MKCEKKDSESPFVTFWKKQEYFTYKGGASVTHLSSSVILFNVLFTALIKRVYNTNNTSAITQMNYRWPCRKRSLLIALDHFS